MTHVIEIEKLGQVPLEQEARLLKSFDAYLSYDDGSAMREHLAAGRSIYFRESNTPAGHVIRENPDGSQQLVRFVDGEEKVVSELLAGLQPRRIN
jgi:hypothetical protein